MRTRQQSFIKNCAVCAFQMFNICDVIQLISGIFWRFRTRIVEAVVSAEQLRTRRSGVRIPYRVPKCGVPIRVLRILHCKGFESCCTRRGRVHSPVRALVNTSDNESLIACQKYR